MGTVVLFDIRADTAPPEAVAAALDAACAVLHEGELRVKRSRVSCFAACKGGPILCVQPDGVWYYNVTPDNMDRIVEQHLVGGRVVEELVFHRGPQCGGQEEGGDGC